MRTAGVNREPSDAEYVRSVTYVLRVSPDVDAERLKAAIAQAAEIAAGVPEAMQDAAFNRALDQLLGEGGGQPQRQTTTREPRSRSGPTPKRPDVESKGATPRSAERLMVELQRADYPQIFSATRIVDRALHLLRVADEDFEVQWLTSPEIARILKERFRLPATRQAVGQALATVPQLLDDRQAVGSQGRPVTEYRIMAPGIAYLDAPDSSRDHNDTTTTPSRPSGKTAGRRKPRPQRRAKEASAPADAESPGQAGTKRRGRMGPKAALTNLIDDGFFKQARTIADVQHHLRHKKGTAFKVTDLSPALVRLLREGKLDRDQAESGQYEYKSP